jgi:predicted ABC-class ATPase
MRLGSLVTIAAVCVALGLGSIVAADVPPLDNVSEVSLLSQAYSTLAKADRDYAGHRKKAMKEITTACDLLGRGISTSGGKNQRQSVSDNELRAAQRIIQRVRDVAEEKDQQEVVKHLENAVQEIDSALKVK